MNVTTPSTAAPPARQGLSAILLTVLFLVAAALLFFGIYISLPSNSHFGALLLIGVLSLVFAGGSYLAESASRDPAAQRSLAWGFLAMGYTTLFLSVGLGPRYGVESVGWMLLGLLLLVVFLAITIVLIGWRIRALQMTQHQEVARAAWRNETPVSAFSYPAASGPSVPTTTPPPAPGGRSPPMGGA
jgi:hypothetical protein